MQEMNAVFRFAFFLAFAAAQFDAPSRKQGSISGRVDHLD